MNLEAIAGVKMKKYSRFILISAISISILLILGFGLIWFFEYLDSVNQRLHPILSLMFIFLFLLVPYSIIFQVLIKEIKCLQGKDKGLSPRRVGRTK